MKFPLDSELLIDGDTESSRSRGVDKRVIGDYPEGTTGSCEAVAPHVSGCCCYQCLGMDQYLKQVYFRFKQER